MLTSGLTLCYMYHAMLMLILGCHCKLNFENRIQKFFFRDNLMLCHLFSIGVLHFLAFHNELLFKN